MISRRGRIQRLQSVDQQSSTYFVLQRQVRGSETLAQVHENSLSFIQCISCYTFFLLLLYSHIFSVSLLYLFISFPFCFHSFLLYFFSFVPPFFSLIFSFVVSCSTYSLFICPVSSFYLFSSYLPLSFPLLSLLTHFVFFLFVSSFMSLFLPLFFVFPSLFVYISLLLFLYSSLPFFLYSSVFTSSFLFFPYCLYVLSLSCLFFPTHISLTLSFLYFSFYLFPLFFLLSECYSLFLLVSSIFLSLYLLLSVYNNFNPTKEGKNPPTCSIPSIVRYFACSAIFCLTDRN